MVFLKPLVFGVIGKLAIARETRNPGKSKISIRFAG